MQKHPSGTNVYNSYYFKMDSNILITGSSGFVGQNLIRYLSENGLSSKLISRQELYEINDKSIVNSQAIVHLAGKAHDLKKTSQPDEYYQVNFEITKKLYDIFLQSGAEKFIYLSSVKAIADTVEGVLTEDAVANPQTHYGKSKWQAEEYIKQQPLPAGKSYYILRPCMIHGAGNKGNLNLLYKFVQKGLPYPLAAFDNKRSFLSVDNLCFVIRELIISDKVSSGCYQVADDEALSTNEVISILNESLDKKPRLWKIPAKLIQTVAAIGDWLKLPLNTERLHKMTENYVVSNAKIKKALQAEFPLTARAGLRFTAESFKKTADY
ncbi:dehydratase [Pedobacter cryoconitis]|uniref:Dehydratase n=2 Tax=Pedobacter cryoconitis TaxID=188932 RepID=A0A127VJE5_9SPHI|nr:dehydratase [Pedobacter cryoconitis]